jgi:hypothetical protein
MLHPEINPMMTSPVVFSSCALVVAASLFISPVSAADVKYSDKAPLGSAEFYPSPEHPIGWRGDGTGCYPGATNPPTVWYQKANGESKNILWKTKLFCYSWSTPIVVGDKIFTLSDPYDLVCLNKNTGKILWIRSFPPFLGVTEEEKKANPLFKDVEPLIAELEKVNDAFVAQGWTKEIYQKKYDLQLKIDELTRQGRQEIQAAARPVRGMLVGIHGPDALLGWKMCLFHLRSGNHRLLRSRRQQKMASL